LRERPRKAARRAPRDSRDGGARQRSRPPVPAQLPVLSPLRPRDPEEAMNASRTSATEGTSNTRMSSGTALPRARALLAAALLSIAGCDFSPITNVGTEVEGLTCTLVTESGLPVAGAWVRVFPASPELLARPVLEDAVAVSARTNAAVTYLFKDLLDVQFHLAASSRR